MLLAFMCEGECEIDEGQLTGVLAIGSRLGGRAGGCKKGEIKSPLWESAWRKSGRMQKKNQKPPMGVEPMTFALQVRRSTTKLRRR